MKLINTEILKSPSNWIFVAVVLVFVVLVIYHFTGKMKPKKIEE